MKITIITGPVASGKTTVADALVHKCIVNGCTVEKKELFSGNIDDIVRDIQRRGWTFNDLILVSNHLTTTEVEEYIKTSEFKIRLISLSNNK